MPTPYEALRGELRQYEKIAVRKTPTNAFLGYEPIFIQWVKDVLVTLRDEEAPRRAQLEVAAALRLLSIGSDAFFLQACRHIESALQRSRDATEDSERTVNESLEKFLSKCESIEENPSELLNRFMDWFADTGYEDFLRKKGSV